VQPSKLFQLEVVTPERVALATSAWFVAFPAYDGEMGVLKNRAPLLTKLGIGIARVESPEGHHRLFIDGGFAQMVDNKLTLLTEEARDAAAAIPGAAEREAEIARAATGHDAATIARRERAQARSRALARLAAPA